MSDSDVPGTGAFTPAGSAWVVGADDQAVSMSPIHHWIFSGSRPTKRRKWRFPMEPLSVKQYMTKRLSARSSRPRVGLPPLTQRGRAGEQRGGVTGWLTRSHTP